MRSLTDRTPILRPILGDLPRPRGFTDSGRERRGTRRYFVRAGRRAIGLDISPDVIQSFRCCFHHVIGRVCTIVTCPRVCFFFFPLFRFVPFWTQSMSKANNDGVKRRSAQVPLCAFIILLLTHCYAVLAILDRRGSSRYYNITFPKFLFLHTHRFHSPESSRVFAYFDFANSTPLHSLFLTLSLSLDRFDGTPAHQHTALASFIKRTSLTANFARGKSFGSGFDSERRLC